MALDDVAVLGSSAADMGGGLMLAAAQGSCTDTGRPVSVIAAFESNRAGGARSGAGGAVYLGGVRARFEVSSCWFGADATENDPDDVAGWHDAWDYDKTSRFSCASASGCR